MKLTAALILGIIGLVAAALVFLLNTTTGLRWTVDQVVARTGALVEIRGIHGRILGPVSLKGIAYRDPESGARVHIDAVDLDWQPGALLEGLLHINRLEATGVEYTPGASAPQADPSLPEISLPLAVKVDALRLNGFAMIDDSGVAGILVEHAALRGSVDADSAVLEDVVVESGDYSIDQGRIRLDLGPDLPLQASLDWRAAPPDLPAFSGGLTVGGALGGTLEPAFEVKAPFAASGRGTVSGLLDTPRWALAVAIPEHVALDGIMGNLPPLSVRGRIRAEGGTDQARLEPDISLSYQDLAATLNGELDVSQEALVVRRARLARPDGSDTVNFSGRFETTGVWSLTANFPELVALDGIIGTLPPLSVQGDIRAEGSMDQARLEPDISLLYQDLAATLNGELDVSREALVVRRAQLARPDGSDTVNFSGRIGMTGVWSLTANVPRPVALDGILPALPPVSVHGDIEAEGDTGEARLAPDVLLVYQDMTATLNGEIEVSPDAVVVRRARLARPDAPDTVNFSGRVGLTGAFPFSVQGDWRSLQGPGEAAWLSRSGEFEAEGDRRDVTASVSGTITPPEQNNESPVTLEVRARELDAQSEITGRAQVPYFAWGDIAARGINVDIDFRSEGEAASDLFLNVAELRLAGREASGIELRVTGAPAGHQASLNGVLEGWTIEIGANGNYEDDRWAARLERLTAAPPTGAGSGEWVMTEPTQVVWSPSRTELDELCLKNAGTEVCANGFFTGQGDWHASAGVTGLSLQRLAPDAPEALRIEGTLEANAEVGNDGDGISGEATARIDRAIVAWDAEDPVSTEYRDMALTATLTPKELRARLEGRLDESGAIQGELVTGDPLGGDGTLRGSISAQLPSLRVIQAAVPALGLQRGTGTLELSVSGTRSAPRLSGDGRIEEAVLEVAPLGIQLSALSLDISSDDSDRLNIEARAGSGNGTLSADGYLEWPAGGGWRTEVKLRGEEADLVRLPQALIEGSPDLSITADETGGSVDGRIRITRAELTPEAGRPQVTISEDIVIKGDEADRPAAQNPMAWNARITVELGDNARFRGYGAQGRLSGTFEINAPSRQPIRANGSIQIHDGKYEFYGRTFDVKRGRLVYTGGPVDNPGIDMEVAKQVRDVNVSLLLTGPLVDPEVQLTSTPAMSETDKMSYLLLGRPASEASGAEAGLLLRAAASLLPGGGGGGVQRSIQSTLGLDTLEVRADDPDTEGAAVEVGKYLAPDLYVSYIAGFQQAVDIFRVRYELARHWLLQAESSTRGSGGDLLFTW